MSCTGRTAIADNAEKALYMEHFMCIEKYSLCVTIIIQKAEETGVFLKYAPNFLCFFLLTCLFMFFQPPCRAMCQISGSGFHDFLVKFHFRVMLVISLSSIGKSC